MPAGEVKAEKQPFTSSRCWAYRSKSTAPMTKVRWVTSREIDAFVAGSLANYAKRKHFVI